MGGFAWVTLATNDSYSLGALVLAHSLRQVGTVHQLAVLVTPGVTNPMRQKLATVFNVVQEVNILDSRDEANLRLLKRPELGITFTKLHCWRLTQFEKCVFLDADTLVLVNSDELFDREEFSAAPDVGWPDCFNSGVFVFRPSNGTYSKLVEFAIEKGSFDGGDQGLLNLYFSDWAHKDISKHLPFIYNMCSTASYSYLPAFKQFGADVKIVHFIGPAKPWLQYFDTESRTVHPSSNLQHLRGVLQTWWDIFCSLIHPNLSPDMSGLAGAFAQFTLGVKRTASQDALENHLRRQGWEVGNIDYMGRDSFDNIWSKICETLASAPPPPQQAPETKPREATPSSDLLQDKPSTPVAETTIHTTESPVEVETAKTESVPTSEPVDTLVAQAVPKPDVTLETAPTDIISEVGLQSQTEPVSQQASEPAAPIQPVTPTEAVAQVPPTQLPQAPQTEADSQQVPETQAPAQQAPQTEASPQTEVAPQLVTQTEVAPQRLPQTEAVPQVPQTEAAPQVPQTEAVPQVPQTEAVPQVPQTEAVPQAPQTETVPQVPQTEAVPQVPQTEAAPQASETEAAPQLPQTEGVPQAPQTGAEPQQVSQTEAATQQVSQTEVAPQQVSQAEAATQQGPQIEVEPQKVPQAEAIPQTEAALQQVPQTEVSQPDAAGLQTEGDPSEVIQPAQLEPIQSPKTQETSQPQATSDVAQQATETPVMQQQTPEPLQELPKPEGQQATETPVIQPKTPEPLQELPKPEGQQQVPPQDAPIETSKVELAQEASEQTIISQEVPQETLQQDVAVPRDTPKPEVLQEVTKPEAEAAQKKSQPEVSQEVLPAAPSSELPQEQSRPEVPQASPVKSQQLPTEAPTTEIKQGTKPAQEETPAVPETIVQEKPKVTKKTTKEGKEKKVVKKTPKLEPATEGAESSKAVGPAETTAEAAASEATPTPPPRKTTTVKKVVKPKK